MHDDLFDRLEHDHAPMSAVLLEIRDWFASADANVADVAQLRDKLELMKELVIEHFGEEEETVFPLLAEIMPAEESALTGLAEGHDAICGLAVRLGAVAQRTEPDLAAMRTLFDRLEASYAEHAKREQTVLRSIRSRLSPAALDTLKDRLRALR